MLEASSNPEFMKAIRIVEVTNPPTISMITLFKPYSNPGIEVLLFPLS